MNLNICPSSVFFFVVAVFYFSVVCRLVYNVFGQPVKCVSEAARARRGGTGATRRRSTGRRGPTRLPGDLILNPWAPRMLSQRWPKLIYFIWGEPFGLEKHDFDFQRVFELPPSTPCKILEYHKEKWVQDPKMFKCCQHVFMWSCPNLSMKT